MERSQRKLFSPGALVVLLFFGLYVVLTFITPQTVTSREQFHISDSALFWIRISIIAPYFLMWFLAFYSMRVLKLIGQKKGEFAVLGTWFSRGFLLLLIGTIATTVFGAIRSFLIPWSLALIPAFTIVINYAHALVPLSAFLLMYSGIRKLEQPGAHTSSKSDGVMIQSVLTALVIGFAHVSLVFTNPNRQIAVSADSLASYYIPDFLIILTLVLPILVGWAMGIAVALKLNKKFLALDLPHASTFVNGIFLVVFSSMILQALLSFGTDRLYQFGLGIILLLVYILVFVQTAGYVLTAHGVRTFES
jgi:hypothetical protein